MRPVQYPAYAANVHVDVYARNAKNLHHQDVSCLCPDPSGRHLIIPCDARHAGSFHLTSRAVHKVGTRPFVLYSVYYQTERHLELKRATNVVIPARGFRRVLHADLDCFFAAVEELDNPALRGKPVIVGGDPDRRGVVSTANYAARRYGIASAMAAAHARRLCPQAIFLRPRFDRYRELSRRVMAILEDSVLALEQVSVDEAFGELPPGLPGLPGCERAEAIARRIKRRVLGE